MKNPLTAGQNIGQTGQMPDIGKMFQQFKQNPIEYLIKAKLNVPQGMTDPQQIVNHFMGTGQIPKQLMPQIHQMMRK